MEYSRNETKRKEVSLFLLVFIRRGAKKKNYIAENEKVRIMLDFTHSQTTFLVCFVFCITKNQVSDEIKMNSVFLVLLFFYNNFMFCHYYFCRNSFSFSLMEKYCNQYAHVRRFQTTSTFYFNFWLTHTMSPWTHTDTNTSTIVSSFLYYICSSFTQQQKIKINKFRK